MTRKLFAAGVLSLLSVVTAVAQEPTFYKINSGRKEEPKNWMEDIQWHRQTNFKVFDDRDTHVHENTHLLDNDLGNAKSKEGGYKTRVWAFYFGKGCLCYVNDPKITKTQVKEFLPPGLQYERFKTYLNTKYPYRSPDGQVDIADTYEDSPLLVWDEWVAYTNGTQQALWDEERTPKDKALKTSGPEACLEFSIYATAVSMAIKKNNPDAWKDEQTRAVFRYQFKRAMKTYREAMTYERFRFTPEHCKAFFGPAGDPLRKFLKEEFGQEFVDDVFPKAAVEKASR